MNTRPAESGYTAANSCGVPDANVRITNAASASGLDVPGATAGICPPKRLAAAIAAASIKRFVTVLEITIWGNWDLR